MEQSISLDLVRSSLKKSTRTTGKKISFSSPPDGKCTETPQDSKSDSSQQEDFENLYTRLKGLVNEVWIKAYGGVAVELPKAVEARVKMLADDRNCWVRNAQIAERERQRIEEILRNR